MNSRFFLTFCMLALFLTVVSVKAEPEEAAQGENDERSIFSKKLIKEALKVLGKNIAGASGECLKEAAQNCKHSLFPVKKLLKCARDYLKENKGACLLS